MRCPECGREVEGRRVRRCPDCGADLRGERVYVYGKRRRVPLSIEAVVLIVVCLIAAAIGIALYLLTRTP